MKPFPNFFNLEKSIHIIARTGEQDPYTQVSRNDEATLFSQGFRTWSKWNI